MALREVDAAVIFDVLVQPRASRAKIGPRPNRSPARPRPKDAPLRTAEGPPTEGPVHDGRLKIAVTAPPVDGEANAAVIELLAKQLGIARSAVAVIAGETSRRKTVRVATTRTSIEALVTP